MVVRNDKSSRRRTKALFPLWALGANGGALASMKEEEIVRRLAEVPAWSRVGDAIERAWKFKDFREAMGFLNRVAELAEAANHHPDIWNSWNRVKLTLTTHDTGGLTNRDFNLAKKIDAL